MQMSGAHVTDTTGVGSGDTLIWKRGACAVLPARVEVTEEVAVKVTGKVAVAVAAAVAVEGELEV